MNLPQDWAQVAHAIKTRVEQVGDCLEWTGSYVKGMPVVYAKDSQGRDNRLPVRRMVAMIEGRRVLEGWKSVCTCGNDRCVSNEHIAVISENAHLRRQAKTAVAKSNKIVRRAKIAEKRRAQSPNLNWEKVQAIRAASGTMSELSAQFGVPRYAIGRIRRNESWVDHTARANPFAAMMR